MLVGLLGWLTILCAGFTLIRAFYTLRKKFDCGLFYQRVLEFSDNVIVRFVHRFFESLFVASFVSIIVLTWIIAHDEMLGLVLFMIDEVRMLFNPWRPKIKWG